MWLVDPRYLCGPDDPGDNNHLLGEHAEMHQAVGTISNHPHGQAVMRGHCRDDAPDDVDTSRLQSRHDELAAELERRGYDHDSPLPAFDDPGIGDLGGDDVEYNRQDLAERCEGCAARMESAGREVVADD